MNRPAKSPSSQVVNGFASIIFATVCAFAVARLIADLKTGQTISAAIIVGDRIVVDKSSSPRAYWINTALYMTGAVVGFIVSINLLLEVVSEHRRKAVERKRRGDNVH
jgi:hypothetical protein